MKSHLVAVVSGGTRGIGRKVRDLLLEEGHSVIFIGSKQESIAENIPKVNLREHQLIRGIAIDFAKWPHWISADWYQCDIGSNGIITNEYYSNKLSIDKRRHSIDLLVNCAGITQAALAIKTSPEEMANIMNVNFLSHVSLTQLVARNMIRSKTKNVPGAKRQILNISSILGLPHELGGTILPGTSMYSASKAAILQFNHVLHQEFSQFNVSVKTITPGLISDTDMIQSLCPSSQHLLRSHINSTTTIDDAARMILQEYLDHD